MGKFKDLVKKTVKVVSGSAGDYGKLILKAGTTPLEITSGKKIFTPKFATETGARVGQVQAKISAVTVPIMQAVAPAPVKKSIQQISTTAAAVVPEKIPATVPVEMVPATIPVDQLQPASPAPYIIPSGPPIGGLPKSLVEVYQKKEAEEQIKKDSNNALLLAGGVTLLAGAAIAYTLSNKT